MAMYNITCSYTLITAELLNTAYLFAIKLVFMLLLYVSNRLGCNPKITDAGAEYLTRALEFNASVKAVR